MHMLRASIYAIPEPSRSMPARNLWYEMASDLAMEFGDRYVFVESWGYRICLKCEASLSPDRKMVRYRTIEASIRRRAGKPTLLDLSVGNLFSEAGASPPNRAEVVNDLRYALWARRAGAVPLNEHVRLIGQFIEDLMDAGWLLQQPILNPVRIPPPTVRNGRGIFPLPAGKFLPLMKDPAQMIEGGRDFCVVSQDDAMAASVGAQLTRAFAETFGRSAGHIAPIRTSRRMSGSMVNLFLIDDQCDLNQMPELRNELRDAEAAGSRFKLAKAGTLRKSYPVKNIAFDLFVIAGGRPWVPASPQPEFCSLDAGHDRERGVSRWVKVESDAKQSVTKVVVHETRLAEHIPRALIDDMWPESQHGILCRDGKLSQERVVMEDRTSREGRSLLESKKSPKAILWRESDDQVQPAEFGDGVFDNHGDLLLQTVPQKVDDYIHPVRLTMYGGDPTELATSYLHQQAIPGLSLFHMSRLPGTLYFADLVSKQTSDGWPKAVGRGFNIPGIIP